MPEPIVRCGARLYRRVRGTARAVIAIALLIGSMSATSLAQQTTGS
jgi:hypothetical protein